MCLIAGGFGGQELLNLLHPVWEYFLVHVYKQLFVLQKHLQQSQLVDGFELLQRLHLLDIDRRRREPCLPRRDFFSDRLDTI